MPNDCTLDKIGTESTIRSNSSLYNEGTKAKQLIHEEVNSAYNHHVIVEAYLKGRAKDIADVEKAPMIGNEKTPCIIVGSGPSLGDQIDFMKGWPGGIFVTTSHALTLVKHGVIPTHLVALDPFCNYEEIEGIDWSKTNTKLVCHPGVWPSLVHRWPNDIILYLENIGRPDSFYSTIQKRMYTVREDQGKGIRDPVFRYIVRTDFAMFACSPPLQLFVADKLGYGTAFLMGVDFGFPKSKDGKIRDRFDNYVVKKHYLDHMRQLGVPGVAPSMYGTKEWDDLWEVQEHPFTQNQNTLMSNNGVLTEQIHLYYKKNFISAWRLSNKTIYTCGPGIMPEIPYTDPRKLQRKMGLNYPQQSKAMIKKITDDYLASIGCYVVEAEKGNSFVESTNPVVEIEQHIKNIMRQYICPTCGNLMVANDDVDYTGKACVKCGKEGIKRVSNVDLEDNMDRVKRLHDKYKVDSPA